MRLQSLLLFPLILLACHTEPTKPTTDTDTDTDSDTDTDTDTDTDADSDADTDIETGTTGETGLYCAGVPNELEPFVEVRDVNGPCTVCTAGEITFFAGIRNPCPMAIDLDVNQGCLVHQFSVSYPGGSAIGAAIDCTLNQQTVTIDPGSAYEEQYHNEELRDSGTYATDADMSTFPVGQSAATTFSIP